MAEPLTIPRMKAHLARSRAHIDNQRAIVLRYKEQGREELSERAAGILLVMQDHVALSANFLARMEAADAQQASRPRATRVEGDVQARFLIHGETLLGTMQGQRDTIPAALTVIADYYAKGCVDLSLTDQATGQIYRWPDLSRDDPRVSDGGFLLERSIKTTQDRGSRNLVASSAAAVEPHLAARVTRVS